MSMTKSMTYPEAKQHSDRRFWTSSGLPFFLGEMACLVLIAIAGALLIGILALPVTMPGQFGTEVRATLQVAATGKLATAQAALS